MDESRDGAGPAGAPPGTVRRRPRWLQALGGAEPPERLTIGGEAHRRVDLFKHDSWAATALYRSETDGRLRVVKLHRSQSAFGVPLAWLGRRVARHERAILDRLSGLPGVPAAAGVVADESGTLKHAVARDFVAGHPLAKGERVGDEFFPSLARLIAGLHERRTLYVDLHKRENIIVDECGRPALIDFQISVLWPSWFPRLIIHDILRRSDEYHLMKHWVRCRPDQCPVDRLALSTRKPWWIRIHRFFARPVREARRRLLVRLAVRSGKGRVESEAFAEEALRHRPGGAGTAA